MCVRCGEENPFLRSPIIENRNCFSWNFQIKWMQRESKIKLSGKGNVVRVYRFSIKLTFLLFLIVHNKIKCQLETPKMLKNIYFYLIHWHFKSESSSEVVTCYFQFKTNSTLYTLCFILISLDFHILHIFCVFLTEHLNIIRYLLIK